MTHPSIFKSDLKTLQAHRMVGEAYRYYQQSDSWDLFQGNRSELKLAYQQIKLRALQQAKALCELHDALTKHMPVIHFKGLTLGYLLYDDIAIRTCRDIDILVPTASRQQAHDIMLKLEYQIQPRINNPNIAQQNYMFSTMKDVTYYHPQTNICIEIHGHFFRSNTHFPPNINSAWTHKNSINLIGRDLPTLDDQHYAIYLIIHGSISSYYRHHWLCDLHQCCLQASIDWNKIVEVFIDFNCEAVLLFSMMRLEHVFNYRLPAPITEFKRNKQIQRRAKKILKFSSRIRVGLHSELANKGSFSEWCLIKFKPLNTVLHLLYLKKSWSYKICCLRQTFPLANLFPYIKLPPKLFWLYEVLKPFFFIYLRFFCRRRSVKR